MAYLSATILNDLQGSNATNEKRFSQLGIVDLAADSTPYVDYVMPSQIQALNTMSSLRDFKFPVIKDQTVVVTQTPGFGNIPSNLEETDQYSYVAYDVFSGLRHYPATYGNNSVDEQFALNQKVNNICYKMGQEMESILETVLSTRKTQQLSFTTQVSQGDGTYSFSTVTDTLTVSKAAQKETMFYALEALMAANQIGGSYRIVTSPAGLAVQKAERLKYSQQNSKDLEALGFFPLDRMYESQTISAGSDVFSGYLVRDGGIGIVPNFPWDFANGTEIDGKKWSISDMELPFCRIPANIYVNRQATNADSLVSGDSNVIMTHFQEMAIWVRFYVVYRYNSDLANRVNDIVKIVGATS